MSYSNLIHPISSAEFKKITIPVKPLSANEAWQGRRFKTEKYKKYEKDVLFLLPKLNIENGVKLKVNIEFGFSSPLSDVDNPTKMILDILVKKYGFDDRYIYELNIKKIIIEKGKEYTKVEIEKF